MAEVGRLILLLRSCISLLALHVSGSATAQSVEEAADWVSALRVGSIDALSDYVARYPDGSQTAEAIRQIISISRDAGLVPFDPRFDAPTRDEGGLLSGLY